MNYATASHATAFLMSRGYRPCPECGYLQPPGFDPLNCMICYHKRETLRQIAEIERNDEKRKGELAAFKAANYMSGGDAYEIPK